MAATDVLNDILRLPPEERARLALELLRSLDGEADPDAAQAWDAEIERRAAEVEAGTAPTMTLDDYRARSRASGGSRSAMSLRHPLAVAEIDHEVDYYESKHVGLGAELEDEIDSALDLVLRFPEIGTPWKQRSDRRVFLLERFPFTLPYQIVAEDIVVLALAHGSKRPGYWARRR